MLYDTDTDYHTELTANYWIHNMYNMYSYSTRRLNLDYCGFNTVQVGVYIWILFCNMSSIFDLL